MNRLAWLLFALVSVLWGIPYFLIKIAIVDLSPVFVVAGRTAIAAAVLIPIALARGTLGALRGKLPVVALIAMVHIVVPFTLITYGEQHISSSLTGILIAIEPVAIALLLSRTEPLTPIRVAGLVIGFAGVVVLVGLDVSGDRYGLLGAGMVLAAAISYAVAMMLVQRKAADIPPEALTVGTTVITTVVLLPFALMNLPSGPAGADSWGALVALGVLCTALALLVFYRLIVLAGSNRAGLVTYVNPVVALLLGVVLLNEEIGVATIAGFALIVIGCWFSTRPASPQVTDPDRKVLHLVDQD
ncbi:drug/metabolite transporter (DMT)-like permease [Actinoplanes lutulentus]|uniref:Drug/metabolite transporter (DMT)-like permease n=1 Tax=Actinoplanes lutulentus TaxID=1287878 RepID=A0A327Z7W2_9ACTN|nr:DMT family transporter [Actinoplanes lutulentus]MBB2943885.1 drug/metabolite transporter (DMT)-like permease [Actinoplanes lutulentus]RAK29424.1 drug/metabolite transporter (DMT)-like permease [Actinoplanes lutulentus]